MIIPVYLVERSRIWKYSRLVFVFESLREEGIYAEQKYIIKPDNNRSWSWKSRVNYIELHFYITMSIFKKIKKILSKNTISVHAKETDFPSMSMKEKENIIFGENSITKKRLYEKWSCKDKWLLYEEGIPLLLGMDPINQKIKNDLHRNIEELWFHARDCVNKDLLTVIDKNVPGKKWQVKPVDLYFWATVSRIAIPDELTYLMEFILQAVKSPKGKYCVDPQSYTDNKDAEYQWHRELTLGATVSLLVNSPELCTNSKNKVETPLIVEHILAAPKLWYSKKKPLLTQSDMEDLINRYIEGTVR